MQESFLSLDRKAGEKESGAARDQRTEHPTEKDREE